MIINTLSLDPGLWGHDSGLARERFERLRRPFAFPLEEPQAASVSLPGGYLAIVTREPVGEPAPRAVYVLHWNDRLELARGVTRGRTDPRDAPQGGSRIRLADSRGRHRPH